MDTLCNQPRTNNNETTIATSDTTIMLETTNTYETLVGANKGMGRDDTRNIGDSLTIPKSMLATFTNNDDDENVPAKGMAADAAVNGGSHCLASEKLMKGPTLGPKRAESMQSDVEAALSFARVGSSSRDESATEEQHEDSLFYPLRFSPPVGPMLRRRGGHHDVIEDDCDLQVELERKIADLEKKLAAQQQEKLRISQLEVPSDKKVGPGKASNAEAVKQPPVFEPIASDTDVTGIHSDLNSIMGEEGIADDGIMRATRCDTIKTVICLLLMVSVMVAIIMWQTDTDEQSFLTTSVGLACVTYCPGNVTTRDFFRNGRNSFETGEVIQLLMNIDPNVLAAERGDHLIAAIVGTETNVTKANVTFGVISDEDRLSYEDRIVVDFVDPGEPHVINVRSELGSDGVSFTLSAGVLTPLAQYSELVGLLILVLVYFLILTEVIHRTLVAVFGSMLALMFYIIMNAGTTESIEQLMMHMEWSTLGLLFGMMLLVGELSHTGLFEYVAVRLLIASKGSSVRLVVMLCTLTAVASAFLDNVTTMLLVAPVTIDMSIILEVDPRPFLIAEVLLCNIGGTATLIGDPPNIIIGSSYDEIGFVDFIINVFPCIFLLCIPASLLVVVYIYRPYFSSKKMLLLDISALKKTYQIYDEPRLMIAGTVTSCVIIMFFLQPVHHKDTAWIALLGAFVTLAFTNPHGVAEALRNHVEWDTLLFFAGLFVLVAVVAAMGVLTWIGTGLSTVIARQPEDKQLPTAIVLIIWVSAAVSAFLDNIPYTVTMIPVVQILADSIDGLPLSTLAWALSFGACLGGNGTLIGASANIVTAGIASSRGYDISFVNFSYPGSIVLLVTVTIATLYMLVVYVWI